MIETGIYIHIPFCKQKCKYCDFISFSNADKYLVDYIESILKEIDEKCKENKLNYENKKQDLIKVNTIYFGGGTPSIIPEQYIEKILNKIKKCFEIINNAEITIEINPGTVTKEKLQKYYDIGINRLSIGLQETNDNLLNMIGRIHKYSDFNEVYEMARLIGFKNINVDLMIGLPTQTVIDVENSVNTIIEKNPEHISVYSLIVEENTKMYELIEAGKLELPSEEIEREMYWKVKQMLEEAGYNHYEISNFSKNNFESKHNTNCWKQQSYLGFGIAAHSYFYGKRYSNIDDLKKYIENCKNNELGNNIIIYEEQDKEDMMKEYMMLGLRMLEGVNIIEFEKHFGCDINNVFGEILNELYLNKLLCCKNNNIKLTNKGLDLANIVWEKFI